MPKILVADDNSNIPKRITEALKPQGIEVVSVGHGEAAVRKLPDVQPDLVLADVFMPVRNGYELCDYIKNDERFEHIPVVLLVGAFDPIDQQEVKRVRADGLLKKPFDPPDDLLNMVRAMLEKGAGARGGPKVSDTVQLSPSEMEGLTQPPPEMEVTAEPEDFAVHPPRIEIQEGSSPLAFGEMLETPSEGPREFVAEEEKPRADVSEFRASSIPDIEFTAEEEEAEKPAAEPVAAAEAAAPAWEAVAAPAEESVPPASVVEEEPVPETPQWGGIETPPREPSPDEPPIPVEFGTSEPLELVTDESVAVAPAHVETAPLQDLTVTPSEYFESAAEVQPVSVPSVEDFGVSATEAPVAEPPAAAREVPVAFEIPPMEEITSAVRSAWHEEAPAAFTPEPITPPAIPPYVPPPLEPIELPKAPEHGVSAALPSTVSTDTFARPQHLDPAMVDAIVEKVVARLDSRVLDHITREILRPIVEALVAREFEDHK